jgi:hypothetical protein
MLRLLMLRLRLLRLLASALLAQFSSKTRAGVWSDGIQVLRPVLKTTVGSPEHEICRLPQDLSD